MVRAWPNDDPYEALLALLDRQIAATDDPQRKSKLQKLASTIADVGKATIAGILAEYAKGNIHFDQTPLGARLAPRKRP